MADLPEIDTPYMLAGLAALLKIPSPTGFTAQAIDYCEKALEPFSSLEVSRNRKGALIARWPGVREDAPRALTAHVDTLGAMVKAVKSNGRLRLTKIGGFSWHTVEGEGCNVYTRGGEVCRGSLLPVKASVHVHGREVDTLKREDESMELRLDHPTTSADETRELGIEVGDYVTFDPRVELNNGFVRSRHLDDKACVAAVLAAVKGLADAGLSPAQTTYLHFSNYEEVGHGASAGIPGEVHELVTVDMAAVGEGQASDEFHATLCLKDSGGPYHAGLSEKLRALAERHGIPHKVDIYPYYGSDGEATWRAGGDLAVALIGPGVDASHHYERTHTESLEATARWLAAYLLGD